VRALLLAVLLAALALPPRPAAAAERHGALIFSRTEAYRHTECIARGTSAIRRMGARNGFFVDATEDPAAFRRRKLARYDVVVFLCTTGDVLGPRAQRAFKRFIRAGGGYAGIHAASASESGWPWYRRLVGARFADHPGIPRVNAQFQRATMRVEDRGTAATRHLGATWTREEEWYNFRSDPRDAGAHVLLTVDESTYDPRGHSGSPGMGRDHPIAWCRRVAGGRSFYTALGHKGAYWQERRLRRHVFGGIRMAAGAAPFRCGRGPVGGMARDPGVRDRGVPRCAGARRGGSSSHEHLHRPHRAELPLRRVRRPAR